MMMAATNGLEEAKVKHVSVPLHTIYTIFYLFIRQQYLRDFCMSLYSDGLPQLSAVCTKQRRRKSPIRFDVQLIYYSD